MTTDDVEHVVHAVDSRPQHLLVAVYFHCFNKLAMLCRRFGPVATRITLSFHALCGQRQCVCVWPHSCRSDKGTVLLLHSHHARKLLFVERHALDDTLWFPRHTN